MSQKIVQKIKGTTFEVVNPNAAALVESLRDIGYNMSTAVADIVDNSITAKAKNISIRVHDDPENSAVAIIDDGIGMNKNQLLEAMRPGSNSPTSKRDKDDLGRFGLGLKTASFSQCRRLTIVTCMNGKKSIAIWDLDTVVKKNAWVVELRDNDDGIRFANQLERNGTLVLWENLDRVGLELGTQNLIRLMDEASRHLELVFHRYMKTEGKEKAIKFNINGLELVPLDPFADAHAATQRDPEDEKIYNNSSVLIKAYVLPHRNKVKSESEWKRMGLLDGHMRSQGFYLYRNRRLIRYATWFRMASQSRLTQLARVKIDIGNENDTDWKIDVLKQSASPPPALRPHLRTIIENLGGKSKRIYKKRGVKLTDENPLPLWLRIKKNSEIKYILNVDHPVVSKFESNLSDDQLVNFQQLMRLFSAGLPMESLQHDMIDNFDSLKSDKLDDYEFKQTAEIYLRKFRELGLSTKEILNIMNGIPPFVGERVKIEKIINGLD
jgi:anti-sigma regulatory factor (Ser/Thr protein kinase)